MLIKQAAGCIASAIEALGSIPWRAMEATVDDTGGKDVRRYISQAAGCLKAAENALGAVPWEGSGASLDDRQGELLRLLMEAMREKRTKSIPSY